ncbi:MAG: DNA polymerase [Kiritimatiellae bacterium]|nr:DNA polymerase [Kiritimatiellia bacterium]
MPFPVGLPRLVLDLETYYDGAYNLEKLDTAAYVRDPSFHIHGVAVAYPDGSTDFRTDVPALIAELRAAYGGRLERVAVVMHNAYFDYFALFHVHGLEIAHVIDTMLISRLLHGADADHSLRALAGRHGLPAKGDLGFMKGVREPDAAQLTSLRGYAVNDAAITASLADILVPQVEARPIELWAMDHSVRMFVERPLAVDAATVEKAKAALERSIAGKVAASGLDETSIRSAKKFPEALASALAKTGRKMPMKPGKKGPIPAVAKGDRDREALLTDQDPDVQALMCAKAAVSSAVNARSRLQRLSASGGRGHFIHSYCGAGTGRYAGGGGFNIQNLRHAEGGEADEDVSSLTRRALRAPPATALVSADASQIEARVLAHLAGQDDLHDDFAKGRDVYSEFASRQFRREVRKPRKDDPPELAAELKRYRQIGKQAILGLGFGMGAAGFIRTSKSKPELAELFASGVLDDSVCAGIVYCYRDAYPKIKEFWGACESAVRSAIDGTPSQVNGIGFHVANGTLLIALPSGRELVYPHIRTEPPTYGTHEYLDRYGVTQSYSDDRPGIVYGGGAALYGGKIVENIVQAFSRDLLVEMMFRLEASGLPVVHHCHDSVTVAVPEAETEAAKARLVNEWRSVPSWAKDLVLDAEAKSGRTLADV